MIEELEILPKTDIRRELFSDRCVQRGYDEQRACYAVCREALVNIVLAMQCAEGFRRTACLLCNVQRGTGEKRACYSVLPKAPVESVLAIQCAEGLW